MSRLATAATTGLLQTDPTDKDRLLDAAVRAGKFARTRRDHYAKLYDADPKATRHLISQLAPALPRGGTGLLPELDGR